MKNRGKFLACLALTFCGFAHACPPGSVLQKGNGWEGCIRTQRTPDSDRPAWKKQWGAIATDGANSALGTADEKDTKKSAEKTATERCLRNGGKRCVVELSYYNQCASMIVGPGLYFIQSAETKDKSIADGMDRCRKSEEKYCHKYHSGCSLPKRAF